MGPTVDELTFWRTCCERGISVCEVPKPFKEEATAWLVEKHPTFIDRTSWTTAYTFDSLEEASGAIQHYFQTGRKLRAETH